MSHDQAMVYLDELTHRYPALEGCRQAVKAAYDALAKSYERGGKLLICGNGGSASDADHIAGELLKGFRSKRPLDRDFKSRVCEFIDNDGFLERMQGSLPAIALPSQAAIVSAVINDIGGDIVYAQQVMGFGKAEDCLLAISTSGNSENILKAVAVARAKGLTTIGLTGIPGGKLATACDLIIQAPADQTAAIQEYHLPIYHALCSMLEARFFG